MTDAPNPDKPQEADRIAKVIARAGLASRREAERMIIEGRVTVNGDKISSPALDVLPDDKIKVDGKPLEEPQETRLWMYYKPVGLVTSESDEKGRQTVFDALPRDLPRVMSVGRLDLNSEGLLLLTNDGELKRRLELPATGWLRRYRVRVNGVPTDLSFDPLRRGVTIDGEEFQPMEVRLDSQQGANAWLTVGIREGRNREIRRAMSHIGLQVNRLIRIGYGPFKLTGLEENEVREVKRRTLRDQLGGLLTGEAEDKPREFRERGADDARPRGRDGDRNRDRDRDRGGERGRDGDRPHGRRDDRDGDRKPRWQGKPDRQRDDARGDRPFKRRDDRDGDGDRKPRWQGKSDKPRDGKRDESRGDRPYARRDDRGGEGDRKPRWQGKPGARGRDGETRDGGKPYARREGDKPNARREGDKPYNRRDGDKPRRDGDRSGPRKTGDKPFGRDRDGKPAGRDGKPRDGGKFAPRGQGGKPGPRKDGPGKGPRPGGSGKPRRDGGPRG